MGSLTSRAETDAARLGGPTKALTTYVLTSMADSEFSTLATITAPCSVNANGMFGENLRLRRWSHFVTTSNFSFCDRRNIKSLGKHFALRFTA